MSTHINVVVRDGDVIQDSGKARHVGQRFAIGTDEWSQRNRSRKVKVLPVRVGTYLLEECKEVLRIIAGFLITTDAERIGGFPAKWRKNESRADVLSSNFCLLKVNSIEAEFRRHIKDSLGELGTVLRGDGTGEVAGTGRSTDGNTRNHIILLSQLDECGNQRFPRGSKAEDRGV